MSQIITEKTVSKERIKQMEEEIKIYQEEKNRQIALLDAPELSDEAKELVVGIRMGLKDIEEGRTFTTEEMYKILFGENGLCK